MTKNEIRNYAYDTIANYLFENHSDFGYHFYDAMRLGGTIEEGVESWLKENYKYIEPKILKALHETAMAWDGCYSDCARVFSLACDIIADCCGVVVLFSAESIIEFTNIRDNMKMGFITIEECANAIADKVIEKRVRPSIHFIDLVLDLVGLPKFVDCVDTRYSYLAR